MVCSKKWAKNGNSLDFFVCFHFLKRVFFFSRDSLLMKSQSVTIEAKATNQYFHVKLFVFHSFAKENFRFLGKFKSDKM